MGGRPKRSLGMPAPFSLPKTLAIRFLASLWEEAIRSAPVPHVDLRDGEVHGRAECDGYTEALSAMTSPGLVRQGSASRSPARVPAAGEGRIAKTVARPDAHGPPPVGSSSHRDPTPRLLPLQ